MDDVQDEEKPFKSSLLGGTVTLKTRPLGQKRSLEEEAGDGLAMKMRLTLQLADQTTLPLKADDGWREDCGEKVHCGDAAAV